jgi:hypothetical protein
MTTATATVLRLRTLALLAACALPSAACDSEQPEELYTMRMATLVDDGCVTLYAGQSIDVGTVCVAVDASVDTSAQCGEGASGAMSVTYTTEGGWTLVETHLAVGDELSDIPTNKKGNPSIGLFPYAMTGMTGATTQTFVVPLCELGIDGADEACEPLTAHLAAHAVVKNGEGGATETAWGDGAAFGGGSWAEQFTAEIECHECDDEVPSDAGEGDGKPNNPLSLLDDELDGDLAGWDVYNPSAADVSIADGELHMVPAAFTQWYGTDEAVHVNKLVSGDFAVTTHITVTDLAGGSTAAGGDYRIGGMLLRDPAGGPNTVSLGIGRMSDASVSTVTKSTDDGQSMIGTTAWAGDTVAELRLCRVGADVQALVRMPGQSWTIIDELVRPDLPATLAAGPMAYAGSATADLHAAVDWVHFRSVESLADCMHE